MKRFRVTLGAWARAVSSRRASKAGGARHLPPFRDLRPLFERELRRSRRYNRPFSVLVLDLVPELDAGERSDSRVRLGEILHDALRETDLVGRLSDRGACVVLMPEAAGADARQGVERIRDLWRGSELPDLLVAAASYPEHGFTLDDLLGHARRSALAGAARTPDIHIHARQLKRA